MYTSWGFPFLNCLTPEHVVLVTYDGVILINVVSSPTFNNKPHLLLQMGFNIVFNKCQLRRQIYLWDYDVYKLSWPVYTCQSVISLNASGNCYPNYFLMSKVYTINTLVIH